MSTAEEGRQQSPDEASVLTRAFHAFEDSDRALLCPSKMRPYSDKWVAAFNGDIVADSDLIPTAR